MKRSTVMYLVNFIPDKFGSFEEFLLVIANKLKMNCHQTVFVFPAKPPLWLVKLFTNAGVKLETLNLRTKQKLNVVLELLRLIKKHKPNIIHVHFIVFDIKGLLITFVTRLSRVPIVTFSYHTSPMESLSLFRRIRLIVAAHIILKHVYKVIAVSKHVKESLARFCNVNPKKIIVIYNGVNLVRFNPKVSADGKKVKNLLGIPAKNFVVTCVAMMTEKKGVRYLLESAVRVTRSISNITFVFVGKGPGLKEFQKLSTKWGISRNVMFIERVNAPEALELRSILEITDVFVLPSLYEAFPYVLVEAMACAKPIIATSVGGIPELVKNGENGLLVPCKNSDALAHWTMALIENKEIARRMGFAGRKMSEQFFDINDMVKKILEVYEESLIQR